jgi:TM2 domain-containing membrane protein YozV
MILNRKDLREAILSASGGGVLISIAFWFRGAIEFYIGQTATSWLLNALLVLYLLSLITVLSSWLDIRNWERTERKQKEEDKLERAKWESEERQQRAEYDAFLNWVRQNPRTADRLMCIAEEEQIEDPEYRSWLIERREREGPNPLTDLSRLFDWLKARRDLKQFGIEPPLPGGDH